MAPSMTDTPSAAMNLQFPQWKQNASTEKTERIMTEATPRERAKMIATEILDRWNEMPRDMHDLGHDRKKWYNARNLQAQNADAAVDLANAVLEWIMEENKKTEEPSKPLPGGGFHPLGNNEHRCGAY
jgi:putative heme degradation protein